MKKIFSLILIGSIYFGKAKAQKNMVSDYLTSYSHTINYSYGKAVFFLSEPDDQIRKADIDKFYYWYSSNQINKTQGSFSGRLLNGVYKEFYVNKNLKEEGVYKYGLKVNTWKTWSEKGILTSIFKYKNGLLFGNFKKFSDEGKLIEAGKYKNGLLTGQHTSYGNLDSTRVDEYKKGQLVKFKESWLSKKWNRYFVKKPSNQKQFKKK